MDSIRLRQFSVISQTEPSRRRVISRFHSFAGTRGLRFDVNIVWAGRGREIPTSSRLVFSVRREFRLAFGSEEARRRERREGARGRKTWRRRRKKRGPPFG